jgi:hypothetical protein
MPRQKYRFPSNPEIVTPTYRGPDRRTAPGDQAASGEVWFDDRGDPVWKFRKIQRRRKDDDTLNHLDSLRLDSLSLEPEADGNASCAEGYDPYARDN